MPKVSVVIPTHNRPELLKKAIASVLAQTYRDFEVIVVDDGLLERSDQVVASFDDTRIKYIQHETERGGSAARNTGIRAAVGQFIAFLDDDDQWLPEKLEIQMKAFELTPNDVGFCFSAVTNVKDGREENTIVPDGIGDYFERALAYFAGVLTVTLIVKKFVFENVGYFDEKFPSHQEADLIIRIAKKYKGLGINKPLVKVTMGGHQQVGSNMKRGILGKEMLLTKHMEEFRKDKKLLAKHYFGLGLLYRDNSQFIRARDIFGQAVRNSFSIRYLMHYASMVFNGRAYKLVRKKKLPKMKLVAIVRAKNSILVLEESMKKLSSLVDEIIVLDNGSTDGTLEMCEKFPKIVKIIRRDDTNNFHEGRDRNLMLEEARKRYPDWITLADPDEVFEKHLSRDIIDKYMHSGHDRIAFRMCNFWLSRKYCRFDRDWFLYTLQPQRQMWRNLEGIHFEDIQIHAWLKGIDSKIYTSPFRIKHYGYINKKNVDAKMTVFKQADPAHPEKYKSSDLEHKESTENILWYPFIEPNNKIANYVYIIFFKLLCDFLLILVKTKRKYFRKLRIFSN